MLSAVIVNHRSNPLADACAASLLGGSLVPTEIVVIDNESERAAGGLSDEVRSRPGVRVVARAENPGYAASCNAGAREARGSWLLFLNADVIVTPACLRRCLEALQDDASVGVVTPRLTRPDGSLDQACHRGLPTPMASLAYKLRLDRLAPRSRRLARYHMTWLDPATDHDVEACSGAFLMLPRDLLEVIGGWDERYRFYAEDLDLCLRVAQHGRRVRYLGTASALHVKGAFSRLGVPDRDLSPDERARKLLVRRDILAAHQLFYELHLRRDAFAPARLAIGLTFAAERLRLEAAARSTRR